MGLSYSPDSLFTLADLDRWDFDGTALAVLGHPVAHSLSPAMHNAALDHLRGAHPELEGWRYFKFEIDPRHLGVALPKFLQAGFRGLNLTVPHKVEAVRLLAQENLGEAASESATRMGAFNTLHNTGGRFEAHNTDGFGLSTALKEELGAITDRDVVLLGAGGAARAAAVQCLQEGCRSLWIGNRTKARLEELRTAIDSEEREKRLHLFGLSDAPPDDLPENPLLLNATSMGLKKNDPAPIDVGLFGPETKVFDMIYQPPRTAFLQQAEKRGLATANGRGMLLWQGVRALEIWTGLRLPEAAVERMRAPLREAFGSPGA